MHSIAKFALESITVEQGHEELEILFFTVVRRRRHEQEVTRELREHLRQPVALGVFNFNAEERCRQLVRFVANDKVPAAIRRLEL